MDDGKINYRNMKALGCLSGRTGVGFIGLGLNLL